MSLSRSAKAHVEDQDAPVKLPDHEHQIFLLIGEVEARELMAGKVPESVCEQARAAVDWAFAWAQGGKQK